MIATTLTLRFDPVQRIDMTGVLPETLSGRSSADIGGQLVRVGGNPVALGDLFSVTAGEGDVLVICSDSEHLDYLGKNMAAGTLRVEGPAGNYAGQGLHGGELLIAGDAGDCAANGMNGGLLHIAGDAGDWLGAALIGERAGMGGGIVAVAGNAGDRLGDRMRRGLILVQGKAGEACAARLLAGTVVVAGGSKGAPGAGLRRGSLIVGCTPEIVPATYNDAGVVELAWLGLLRRHVERILPGVVPNTARVRRYAGDMAFGGKGEILVSA